jgi:hypothetical protein
VVSWAQGEMQKEAERPEHEGEGQRRDAQGRSDASAEPIEPDESTRDQIEGEHMEPDGEAPSGRGE